MNELERAIEESFGVVAEVAGTRLTFDSCSFLAVVSPVPRDQSEYQAAQSEQLTSIVEIDRDDFPDGIVVGSELLDYANSKSHRVKEIIDHPQDTTINLRCATFPADI